MKNIEKRLSEIESRLSLHRVRTDPCRVLLILLQLAQMEASVPIGDDDSPERIEQLANVKRFQSAYETGNTDLAEPDYSRFVNPRA